MNGLGQGPSQVGHEAANSKPSEGKRNRVLFRLKTMTIRDVPWLVFVIYISSILNVVYKKDFS